MLSSVKSYLSSVLIPLYAVLILIEIILSNWQHKKYYSIRETIKNLYLTILNAGLDLLLRAVFYVTVLMWYYDRALLSIENIYLYWVLLFFFEDLAIYVEHYVDHHSRMFWAVHITHHSSEEYNLTTGFRSSFFQPVYRFIYFIPLTFIGFQPLDILLMYTITQTYGILLHTQYIQKIPKWFEAVFVSPSHHRVHYGSNLIYLDKIWACV
jgi:sterol desaturase/sphingolipid hydroxylase (fatty acid hydroxylase superfamily)